MNDFIVMYLDSMKMNNTSHLDKVLLIDVYCKI